MTEDFFALERADSITKTAVPRIRLDFEHRRNGLSFEYPLPGGSPPGPGTAAAKNRAKSATVQISLPMA
jgi:hypothetical protein